MSSGDEPDTLRLVAWLGARGVRVLLPLLTDGSGGRLAEPAWAAYDGPDALRAGPLGLLEPTTTPLPARQLPEAELVVCPGLAADVQGDRLGRGGGWYDRALVHAGQSAPVVVLLNRDEVLAAIPAQPWDRRVDRLATPEAVVDCEPPYARLNHPGTTTSPRPPWRPGDVRRQTPTGLCGANAPRRAADQDLAVALDRLEDELRPGRRAAQDGAVEGEPAVVPRADDAARRPAPPRAGAPPGACTGRPSRPPARRRGG